MREIITRAEAKARGLKRYFTGKPCCNGHICERLVLGGCIKCRSERRKVNRVCRKCSLPFVATNRPDKYCSAACNPDRVHRARRAAGLRLVKPCRSCGTSFAPNRPTHDLFCSEACRDGARRASIMTRDARARLRRQNDPVVRAKAAAQCASWRHRNPKHILAARAKAVEKARDARAALIAIQSLVSDGVLCNDKQNTI